MVYCERGTLVQGYLAQVETHPLGPLDMPVYSPTVVLKGDGARLHMSEVPLYPQRPKPRRDRAVSLRVAASAERHGKVGHALHPRGACLESSQLPRIKGSGFEIWGLMLKVES